MWQVRVNAQQSIWQQIHREIADANRKLMHSEVDVSSYVRKTALNYSFLQQGLLQSFQDARPTELLDLISALNAARSDLIHLLETYEISSPELKIFRTAFNVAFHDMEIIQQKIFGLYLKTMSIDGPEPSIVFNKPTPNLSEVEVFKSMSDDFINSLMVISNFTWDLNVETQNLLLGGMFKHRVPKRKPLDPSVVVVSLEEAKKLDAYFENETAWGLHKKKVEEDVCKQFS